MTEQETALRELLAKGTDASFLREMIGFAAGRLMELEVGALTGAARGERSPDCRRARMASGRGSSRRRIPAGCTTAQNGRRGVCGTRAIPDLILHWAALVWPSPSLPIARVDAVELAQ